MLQKKYVSEQEANALYDYTDIAEGTGLKRFYLLCTQDNGGLDYHLTDTQLYSNTYAVGEVQGRQTLAADGSETDTDFDLSPFNTPKTIKGTAVVSIGHWARGDSSSTVGSTIQAKIRKWDGTTETEIASATTAKLTDSNEAETNKIECFKITVPQTHFKAGETLRLTIIMTVTNEAGSGGSGAYAHDPMNQDAPNITPSTEETITASNILLPFKLDL